MAESTPNPIQILEERIAQAAKVMGISARDLWAYLSAIGIESGEDGLSLLEAETTREGDARAVMVEQKGLMPADKNRQPVKIARFSAGWAILKGRSQTATASASASASASSSDVSKLVESLRPVAQYSDAELLAKYNEDASSEILEELNKRSNERPFIVFDDEKSGKIDTNATIGLLRNARRHETPATFMVAGKFKRVYRVGEFPMLFVEECPLHSDTLLTDGFCERCQNTWKTVNDDARVLVRVALDAGHISFGSLFDIDRIIDQAFHGKLLENSRLMTIHEELKEENKLPLLRRRMSHAANGKSDPFYIKR